MTVSVFQPTNLDVEINSFGGGNGTSPNISVTQNMKALFYFDLSSISSTDICSSAVFSLYNVVSNYAISLDIYSIKSANSGWNESATNTTINGTTAWAGSNWCGTAGTDYESVAIGSATGVIGFYAETSWNLTPSVVKTWFGASSSNYGFFVTTSSLSSNFYYTREEVTRTSNRPKLTVTHSPVVFANRRTLPPLGSRVGSRSER